MAKGFFIDLTRCTACRGCQVACKQWKKLPATETQNWGSHQNPKTLDYNTLKLVHFKEVEDAGKLQWLFFPEQCRHCPSPPCMLQSDVEGAITQDEATGAVLFHEKTKELDFEDIYDACPYNIPRVDEKSKQMSKCDMCFDRIQNGMLPACVLSCPTGTMNFGEYEDMKKLAEKRLAEVKKKFPKAVLGDPDDVLVIYLFQEDPASYHESAIAGMFPSLYSRKQMFAKAAKPVKRLLT